MLINKASLFLLPGVLMASVFLCKPENHFSLENQGPDPVQAYDPVVVLQLFTSQGCSSCPPADALLKKLKDGPGNESIFCIAYHVDYWDYIGWEDPFGTPENTRKQKEYATKFGNGRIYTPQLVINGKEHLVGSDAARIKPRIAAYRNTPSSNSIEVSASRKGESAVRLDYKVLGPLTARSIRAVLVLDEKVTRVKRGENRDRVLVNTAIALSEESRPLTDPTGSLMLNIPSTVNGMEALYLVVLTETGNLDITGAVQTGITAPMAEN